MGRDVKGGIEHLAFLWRHSRTVHVDHLVPAPVFDRDLLSRSQAQVDRGGGHDCVHRNVVFMRDDGQLPVSRRQVNHVVGSDLVGDIAVSGNAIRSEEHTVDLLRSPTDDPP